MITTFHQRPLPISRISPCAEHAVHGILDIPSGLLKGAAVRHTAEMIKSAGRAVTKRSQTCDIYRF